MNKTLKKALTACTAAAVMLVAGAWLVYKEIIKLNSPSREEYPIRGIDVSSYQGEIDWQTLSQGLDFAYIKATEGSTFTDECFAYNYEQARKTGLRVGAYHFFSFESGGDTQAENFISRVEGFNGMLPPVIDVELYGDYTSTPLPADKVVPELKKMYDALETHYITKPVFYATGSGYELYIKDSFPDCRLWIRDVYTRPSDSKHWCLWQYSGKGRLDGYNGEEKYIDLNVYSGSREDFYNNFV